MQWNLQDKVDLKRVLKEQDQCWLVFTLLSRLGWTFGKKVEIRFRRRRVVK